MWNSIVSFLASIIDVFYNWTGNFGVAVIIFTIIVKGVLLPLDIKSRNIDNVNMNVLSMGMTNDYMVAVEEGATMVRVGTGIFGARNYNI